MDKRANFLSLILLDALEDGSERDVENILSHNHVDASYVAPERGIAPIHYACGMDDEHFALKMTKRFLENGANPNVRTDDQMTPLHVAAMYGRTEIVTSLLQHGAELSVYDADHKLPLHYAIEEGHFDVVLVMRNNILLEKCEKKKQKQTKTTEGNEEKYPIKINEPSILQNNTNGTAEPGLTQHQLISLTTESNFNRSAILRTAKKATSTPQSGNNDDQRTPIDKNKLGLSSADKHNPSVLMYNYDTASPYYINITHRRNTPQPKFPSGAPPAKEVSEEPNAPEIQNSINVFSLTRENLEGLSRSISGTERSRGSVIEMWRERVQRSRRQSVIREFDDVSVMIDHMVADNRMNFNNTVLKEKDQKNVKEKTDDADSGACGSGSVASTVDETVYRPMPLNLNIERAPRKSVKISLGGMVQDMAGKAQETDCSFHTARMGNPCNPETNPPKSTNDELQIPQVMMSSDAEVNWARDPTNFIRSPSNREFFLQLAEAYVHTDDENGLVFYETKLLSNRGQNLAKERMPGTFGAYDGHDITKTTQSTDLTLPSQYDTDALREELTFFGQPPGPITKTTKRMYIKRVVKCKRNTERIIEEDRRLGLQTRTTTKYSVELHRTVESSVQFERIPNYMELENQSAQYFTNSKDKALMREGHLKQSFIYLLIDPLISCNLPSESVYLDKLTVWRRFLQSVFYVGKGKTSRPYSHLYEAMKTHSRSHLAGQEQKSEKLSHKILVRKQQLNADIFKSPPEKSTNNKKLDRILQIWAQSKGVVCLHVYHNILPSDAYTREAAIIEALSLQHLTNIKRGDYYGPAKHWTMRDKKFLGIGLLYRAMLIYLAEGESQLSPSDLI